MKQHEYVIVPRSFIEGLPVSGMAIEEGDKRIDAYPLDGADM
jgi:hypothetical protein